jgi:hypothetical protein
MRVKRKTLFISAAIILIIAVVVFVWILKNSTVSPLDTGTSWFVGQGESDAYVFPAQEEWVEIEPQERYAALQIPENILKEMSTSGLAETCINYPLLGNMAFYDSLEIGFERIQNRFNGLQELFVRSDVADILVAIFVSMDLNKLNQYGEYPTLKFHYVCIMLYQEPVINVLTGEQKKELLKAISEKRKLINSKYNDHYSLFNLEVLEQRIK